MKKRGKGIGAIFYGTGYGNGYPDVSTAWAEVNKEGQISIYMGATEVGQGSKTIFCQMAAEILGVGTNEINFICEDTSQTPDAGTAAASRQTYNSGNAVKQAAEELKKKLIERAQSFLQLDSVQELEVEGHWVYIKDCPERKMNFKDLAGEEGFRVIETFIAKTEKINSETGEGAPYWPYTFCCYGVEVEVDTKTGVVEVIRGVCAQDVGRAINPELIEGQIDGGFAMGLGYSLMEGINLSQGEIKNNRFSSYLIPTALDVPDLEKIIIEDPSSTGPFGAKGIGEPVMIPVAPAILNAIYDAIGIRFYEIPVTPERILLAINAVEREE